MFAASGGDADRAYPWGDAEPDQERANYLGIQYMYDPAWGTLGSSIQAVALHPSGASPFGLMDMGGNAWELVLDKGSPLDWSTVQARGGCYNNTGNMLRLDVIPTWRPRAPAEYIGIRLVKDER